MVLTFTNYSHTWNSWLLDKCKKKIKITPKISPSISRKRSIWKSQHRHHNVCSRWGNRANIIIWTNERFINFQRTMVLLIFESTRVEKDIKNKIYFLSTLMQYLHKEKWDKMKWVIQYTNKITHLILVIHIKNINNVKCYIDLYFAVNSGMKYQIRGALTIGGGLLMEEPKKKKTNTRNSMEVELVEVNNIIP